MKINKLMLSVFFLFSFCCDAAFSEKENEQLSKINNKSQAKVESIISSLNDVQKNQIKDNPESKVFIENLRSSWDMTIKKRCELETSESKGTDAEISATNDCLAKGYGEELEYFKNMLP
jgi:hypothetical protein